jgi:hypothetical protein
MEFSKKNARDNTAWPDLRLQMEEMASRFGG